MSPFSHSVSVLSCFSRVRLLAILWTVAHQAPLFMAFSRQEYWSGLPFPSPLMVLELFYLTLTDIGAHGIINKKALCLQNLSLLTLTPLGRAYQCLGSGRLRDLL